MKMKHVIISVVGVLLLGVAYYGISPLFRNVRVDETLSGASVQKMEDRAEVVGTIGHPASGFARIISADGKQYLRYEDFKTINGPDIYVYLAKDPDAKEFVNLGRVRATEGNINYEIPAGVDPHEYPYALTWGDSFNVLFNSAKLY
jgi:hypothetical protein